MELGPRQIQSESPGRSRSSPRSSAQAGGNKNPKMHRDRRHRGPQLFRCPAASGGANVVIVRPSVAPTTLFGPPDSARALWCCGGIGVAQLPPVPGGPVRLELSTVPQAGGFEFRVPVCLADQRRSLCRSCICKSREHHRRWDLPGLGCVGVQGCSRPTRLPTSRLQTSIWAGLRWCQGGFKSTVSQLLGWPGLMS